MLLAVLFLLIYNHPPNLDISKDICKCGPFIPLLLLALNFL